MAANRILTVLSRKVKGPFDAFTDGRQAKLRSSCRPQAAEAISLLAGRLLRALCEGARNDRLSGLQRAGDGALRLSRR